MTDHPLILFGAFPATAYLIGSIPFGYLIGRAKGVDIRTAGSRNIGATNVGRVLGRKWGCLCFALDVAKGLLPVLVAGLLLRPAQGAPELHRQAAWLGVALGCILGHMFTLWLGFRGGKGVATSLGVVLGFYPYYTGAGLAALAMWIVAVLIWRYVSLASIIASGAFPLLLVGACRLAGWPVADLWPLLAFALVIAVLIVVRHRTNISRLLSGTENKVLTPRRPPPPSHE